MFSEYSQLIKNFKTKPFQLLRGTKTLALSSEKFSSFCQSNNNTIISHSFKINFQSPRLNRNNNELNITNKIKKINNIPFSATKRPNKLMRSNTHKNFKKKFLFSKTRKKKNVYFFVGENYFKHINKNIAIRLENLEIQKAEKKVKDFFILLDSIFYEENYYYNKLKYKEEEIYGHKEEYKDYLKEELNYYINKEKDLDMKTEYYKLFEIKKYGKIDLFFKSFRIEIMDIFNKLVLTIPLPFNLMPLLYLCDNSHINELLVLLLQSFDIKEIINNSPDDTSINDELKKKTIFDILSNVKIEKGKIKFDMKQSNYERHYSKLKYLEIIKDSSDSHKYKYFLNEFYKDENVIKVVDKSNHNNLYETPNFKNINKINFETNINKYQLYLIQENSIFKINFVFPEIILGLKSDNKQMKRYINKELFIYLHQNNYMNWDFYLLHFLYSFKYIRRIMSGIFSVKNNKNNIINLSKRFNSPKENINLFNKLNFNSFEEKESDNVNRKLNLNLTNINSYNSDLNSTIIINARNFEYPFLFMDNVNLSLFKLRSYTVYAFFVNIKKPIIYEFNFNFQHMKILHFINLFEKLGSFLYRLIYIKNDEINFNYSYFDHFLTMSNRQILNYFNEIYILKEEKEKDFNFLPVKEKDSLNSISLRIIEPYIEVLTINQFQNKFKVTQSNIKLKSQFMEDLIKKNMKDWIYVINKHKNELNNKNYVKYEETRNKKVRRKSSLFNNDKNRNLKKVFNKFLKIS